MFKKRYLLVPAALFASANSFAAATAIDVSEPVAQIAAANTAIMGIGGAVLAACAIVLCFKLVKRLM